MTDEAATMPATIDVERTSAVTIRWGDGHVSRFDLRALRLACPCAGCQSERSAGRPPRLVGSPTVVSVDLTGAWGMTPTWSDGHATGIYPWTYLRSGCPCEACRPA